VTHFPEWPKVKQQPKRVEYPSTDDVKVPALLLEPKDFVPGHSPAVVWVHGGPAADAAGGLRKPPWSCYLNALLDAGFLVLMPDYRGSNGHSVEWSCVTSEQRGVIDVDDVVAAKGFLDENGLAAPGRVALAGASYGGYLTLMALARGSEEWACTASLWGMWDPMNLRIAWVPDNEELPDLAQRTPNNLLHKMHRPLLIIHAAYDTQSTVAEVNRASEVLRSNGTPCELYILEDAHGLPLHTDEAAELLAAFLTRHMPH
jgi:dipeptidyl aminopeptidase/acylaminoacyl peptidase